MELQHALAVEVGRSELREDNISDVDDIVSVCAGLVTVDEESGIIRLVHYTTQEYFERTQARWFPLAETDITNICVTYLSFSIFGTGLCHTPNEFLKRRRLNPLYDYAANNWGKHACKVQKCDKGIIDFLQDVKKVEASSQGLLVPLKAPRYPESRGFLREVTGLHLAVYLGVHSAVSRLLQLRQDTDLNDSEGRTPLSYAARGGHKHIVQLLLENGANIESRDIEGRTPLSHATEKGHKHVVQLLLEKHANIEPGDTVFGQTPLSYAAENGHNEVVQLLLEKGANIESRDTDGQTPLSYAAKNGHEEVVQLLLNKGANIESGNQYSSTPLLLAAKYGRKEVVQLLLEKGANIETKDEDGWTPLWLAVENEYETIEKIYLTLV